MKTICLIWFIFAVLTIALRIARLCICDYPISITQHRYEDVFSLAAWMMVAMWAASLLWG